MNKTTAKGGCFVHENFLLFIKFIETVELQDINVLYRYLVPKGQVSSFPLHLPRGDAAGWRSERGLSEAGHVVRERRAGRARADALAGSPFPFHQKWRRAGVRERSVRSNSVIPLPGASERTPARRHAHLPLTPVRRL